MDIRGISPEMRERAKACKTTDEVAELALEGGVELSDEQLEAISGGSAWNSCGSHEGNSSGT